MATDVESTGISQSPRKLKLPPLNKSQNIHGNLEKKRAEKRNFIREKCPLLTTEEIAAYRYQFSKIHKSL